jgi:hypothetical protein
MRPISKNTRTQQNQTSKLVELFSSCLITATIQKTKPGFGAAGVWPLNPDLFTEVDFEPDVVLQTREHAEQP